MFDTRLKRIKRNPQYILFELGAVQMLCQLLCPAYDRNEQPLLQDKWLFSPIHRIVVVKEKTSARVEHCDSCHIPVRERKVENIEVLSHPLYVGRFWDDDDAALNEPSQGDLRHRFAVLMSYFGQYRIRKETVAPLCERSPRHDARAKLLHRNMADAILIYDKVIPPLSERTGSFPGSCVPAYTQLTPYVGLPDCFQNQQIIAQSLLVNIGVSLSEL